ncbi:MAG: hypothetical protein KC416_13785, partial [Myxococcales bacterium]|nr:hypothetical protein [Myxococcales bacterium]
GFAGGQSGHFRGVGFGNGVFVAVGHGGDNQNGIILYSTDKGVTWKSPDVLPADAGLLNVGYGPFGFVAVGWGGRRVRSTDGRVWTDDTRSLTNENVTGVVYGDGLYVAASNAGILTSPDGAEPWTYYPYPNGSGLSQVAYMDGKFYVAKGGVLWSTVDFVSYTKLATAPAGYRAIVSGKLN